MASKRRKNVVREAACINGNLCHRVISLLLLLVFFLNLFLLSFHYDFYINILEVKISHLGHIEHPASSMISLQIFLVTMLFGWHAVVTRRKFFKESFDGRKSLDKMFYISALLMIVSYHFFKDTHLYEEDGVFESLTAVLALFSSLMLLIWSFARKKKAGMALGLFLSLIFFLFGMEEINWGQRIFPLEAQKLLTGINVRTEMSLHNSYIFNSYLYPLTQLFDLLMAAVLFYLKELRSVMISSPGMIACADYIPPSRFVVYGVPFLFLSLQCAYYGGELSEEIFAVFGFVYACNLYFPCGKLPADGLSHI